MIKKSRTLWSVIIVFCVICIGSVILGFRYYQKLNSTIYEESEGYLQEVARRIGTNVDQIFEDNFGVLSTMAVSLENMEDPTTENAQKILQKQFSIWNYEDLMLIDNKGRAFNLNEKEVFLSLEDSVREDLLVGKRAMSTAQIIDNQEYIIFFVPFHDFSIGDTEFVALAGSYAPKSFHEVLSMKAFNDRSYAHMISRNGSVVVRSLSDTSDNIGYNIFTSLKSSEFGAGSSLENLEDDINNGQLGQVDVTVGGERMYMVYVPIQTQDFYILSFVPVQVVNEKSDILLKSTLFICGFVALIFAGLAATVAFAFNSHRRKLEEIAYVDSVTGGNTIQKFYQLSEELLKHPNKRYAMVYTNVVKFKVLNEQLGRKNCDIILSCFYQCVNETLSNWECMGRLGGDNFCILIEYTGEEAIIDRFISLHRISEKYIQDKKVAWNLPITEFGVYVIDNPSMPFSGMIDRAKLAIKETSGNIENKLYYSFYDDSLHRQLMREKQLEDRMVNALKQEEFRVFLQPKYRLPEEQIGGAEALVRWQSEEEGMIFPDEFIPLFEKNGFIVTLDLWVYEVVCQTLRDWIDRGLKPIKVSVNCSRVHFRDADFLQPYIKIAENYNLDKNLIEIEITESMVLENSDRLIQIIENIRAVGFGCSMDDFGSGYSSLNLIQTIPVDTLKLDKIFFRGSLADIGRTQAVVKSIVGMAQALKMETVAEGVEHREQVDMLKNTGCNYIQGYVFSKPIPIHQFEELAFEKKQ